MKACHEISWLRTLMDKDLLLLFLLLFIFIILFKTFTISYTFTRNGAGVIKMVTRPGNSGNGE